MGLKLHQLRYLVALADGGSIRGAARYLGISQASVTQGLGDMERAAGTALFDRRSQGAGLTEAGLALLEHARRLLAEADAADQTLARWRGGEQVQRLGVGITPWVAQTLLAPVLTDFRTAWPQVRLELFDGLSALAYPRLREGSLHLMVGRVADAQALVGLQVEHLLRYDMAVVARRGHPLSQARSIHELAEQDWAVNFVPRERDAFLQHYFGTHGLEVPEHRVMLVHSPSLMLTLVRQTDMLSIAPWPLIEAESVRLDLQALTLRETMQGNVLGLIRRANEVLPPAGHAFVELLKAEIARALNSTDPLRRRLFQSVDACTVAPSL